jgi:hypothetical protein
MMPVALALSGIVGGASCLLLWPSLGAASLLLYPVFGSAGAAVAALLIARNDEPELVDRTDELVAELRGALSRDPGRPTVESGKTIPTRRAS